MDAFAEMVRAKEIVGELRGHWDVVVRNHARELTQCLEAIAEDTDDKPEPTPRPAVEASGEEQPDAPASKPDAEGVGGDRSCTVCAVPICLYREGGADNVPGCPLFLDPPQDREKVVVEGKG